MQHKIKTTQKKYITQEDHRYKIYKMVDSGYTSSMIDGKTVTIISSDIVNVNNKAEILTIVEVV